MLIAAINQQDNVGFGFEDEGRLHSKVAGGVIFGQGGAGLSVWTQWRKRVKDFSALFLIFVRERERSPRIEREEGFYREDLGFKDA